MGSPLVSGESRVEVPSWGSGSLLLLDALEIRVMERMRYDGALGILASCQVALLKSES